VKRNEGQGISEKNMRKVQDNKEKTQDYSYMREPETQAKAGMILEFGIWNLD
jgi:Asp-tRNA(Asn)/Glu-tRNA(Gln) amidotransferase B subunit